MSRIEGQPIATKCNGERVSAKPVPAARKASCESLQEVLAIQGQMLLGLIDLADRVKNADAATGLTFADIATALEEAVEAAAEMKHTTELLIAEANA
jgi:hypothetical protein